MLVALGFLSASLLALAALPALARRADRLARKRAEAAFPLSLAEIAADRDHLRAELAVRERAAEQGAERAFADKAAALQQLGRRDMTIGRLEANLAEREARIAALEETLASLRAELAQTSSDLASKTTALAETSAALEGRLADLASLEHNLAETRAALTGTGADLAARSAELDEQRDLHGRVEALLATRESELDAARSEADQLRVAQVEARTRILVLDGKSDELSDRLAATERALAESRELLARTTEERDGERLRADAFAARVEQAEAGLAAADARAAAAVQDAGHIGGRLRERDAALASEGEARRAAELALARSGEALTMERERAAREESRMGEAVRQQEERLATLHAEIQTLHGSLEQARAERERLHHEATRSSRTEAADKALRDEIVKLGEALLADTAKREAAE